MSRRDELEVEAELEGRRWVEVGVERRIGPVGVPCREDDAEEGGVQYLKEREKKVGREKTGRGSE